MGQEIPHSSFTESDFQHYREMLKEESHLLKQWFDEERFVNEHPKAGCELEAWLIDQQGVPAPVNVECLEALGSDQASPELSQFNIELNFDPVNLNEDAFSQIHKELVTGWQGLREAARRFDADCVCTGILQTVRN
ncbi:MAG: glutamate--cysteine ligase, partial [Gammaproteobacteria bacterium]